MHLNAAHRPRASGQQRQVQSSLSLPIPPLLYRFSRPLLLGVRSHQYTLALMFSVDVTDRDS